MQAFCNIWWFSYGEDCLVARYPNTKVYFLLSLEALIPINLKWKKRYLHVLQKLVKIKLYPPFSLYYWSCFLKILTWLLEIFRHICTRTNYISLFDWVAQWIFTIWPCFTTSSFNEKGLMVSLSLCSVYSPKVVIALWCFWAPALKSCWKLCWQKFMDK